MSNKTWPEALDEIAQLRYGAPEFIRLPKSGTLDPLFGLSLILPTEASNHRPPVKSICLRQRGAQRGVRLIVVDSLRAYILAQATK